jgi:predicted permease
VRLHPPAYRERFGEGVTQFCLDRVVAAHAGGEAPLRTWARVVADLGLSALVEWGREATKPRGVNMTAIITEFAIALRALRRSPAFSLASIATLALGIGAATAIYSVVDAVLLRPMPYVEPERVVVPQTTSPKWGTGSSIAYADFMDWREEGVFGRVAVYQQLGMDLASDGEPARVNAAAVGPEFFAALGAVAQRGRAFDPGDFPVTAGRAVVISDRLWRTHFGGRDDIVGLEVEVNAIPRPIVGVLPPQQEWPLNADLWVPLRFTTELDPDLQRRDNFVFEAIARLAPGRTLEETRAAMARLAALAVAAHPSGRDGVTTGAVPVLEYALGPSTPRTLWLLLGAVALLLLIGCVNVANLQLARATARRHDLAVRAALGASRYRLVRQTLVESLTLAAAGGALGALLAHWLVAVIVAVGPADVPRIAEAAVDPAALAFALAVSVVVALLFGLAPAMLAARSAPAEAIAEAGARGSGGRRSTRTRRLLVAFELALSVVLLAGAGLAVRSITALRQVDTGFDAAPVITASIRLPGIKYDSQDKVATFMYELRDRLTNTPGIGAAGVTSASPMGAGGFYLGRSMIAEGLGAGPDGEISVQWNAVTPGYFAALGVPLKQGRDFTSFDGAASAPVMIVSEGFARAMFPGQDPVGRRAMSSRDEKVYREIVGVVGDVRYFGARDSTRNLVWVPYAQNAWGIGIVTVRATGTAAAAIQGLRSVVGELEPSIALADVATMHETMGRALARDNMIAVLLGVFAALALLLAVVGIFGMLSYAIAQRTREFGIRLALGAQGRNLVRLVIRETMPIVLGGVVAGVVAGVALSRLVVALFYGIRAGDPVTFGGVAVVLALVAIVAALVPARRAGKVDPVHVLRGE